MGISSAASTKHHITMKVLAILALAADAPRYGVPAPVYRPAPVYKAAPAYQQPAYEEPTVYAYNYAVNDDYTGTNFNAAENRDGYSTSGSYSVDLPDGRTQTVNYNVADGYSGYVADVQYSGYAAAPAYKAAAPVYKAAAPVYRAAAPAYKPAPVYQPAPVYKAAPAYLA